MLNPRKENNFWNLYSPKLMTESLTGKFEFCFLAELPLHHISRFWAVPDNHQTWWCLWSWLKSVVLGCTRRGSKAVVVVVLHPKRNTWITYIKDDSTGVTVQSTYIKVNVISKTTRSMSRSVAAVNFKDYMWFVGETPPIVSHATRLESCFTVQSQL